MRATSSPGCLTEARFLILLSLNTRALHGYGILKSVRALGNSKIRLANGTLYGALRELTEDGWITIVPPDEKPRSRRRTTYYALTEAGRDRLAVETARLRWLVRLVEERGL